MANGIIPADVFAIPRGPSKSQENLSNTFARNTPDLIEVTPNFDPRVEKAELDEVINGNPHRDRLVQGRLLYSRQKAELESQILGLMAKGEALKNLRKKPNPNATAAERVDHWMEYTQKITANKIKISQLKGKVRRLDRQIARLPAAPKIEKRAPLQQKEAPSFHHCRSTDLGIFAKVPKEIPNLQKSGKAVLQNKSDLIIVGDSIAEDLQQMLGKEVTLVGGYGLRSGTIRHRLEKNRESMDGKSMMILNAGPNDLRNPNISIEEIVANIDAMIEMGKEAGIEKFAVLTRFPFEEAYGNNIKTRRIHSLVNALREKYGDGADSQVTLVDLNEKFMNSEGRLISNFESKNLENRNLRKDKTHPHKAYPKALRIIAEETSEWLIALWINERQRLGQITV